MNRISRIVKRLHVFAFFALSVLILGLLPPQSASAAVVTRSVDNVLADYSAGTFQRAALSPVVRNLGGSARPVDQSGAVQLGPKGTLKSWTRDSVYLLPQKLQSHSSVVIGNRIFVIGGLAYTGSNSQRSKTVYSAAVDLSTGSIVSPGWETEPDLVAAEIQPSETSVAEISSAAAVSVSSSGGGGYIYLIGGNAGVGGAASTTSLSSYSVRVAKVGTDNRISSWAVLSNARVPASNDATCTDTSDYNCEFFGIQGASAVSLTIGSKTYVYLVSGVERYRDPSVTERGSKHVYYAEARDGKLYKPNTSTEGWTKLDDIPVSSGAGIWYGSAVADYFPAANSGAGGYGLYVIGGQQTTADVANAVVYRASINSSTGTLTWSGETPKRNLPTARIGLATSLFRGNFYVSGGNQSGGLPEGVVDASYVEDDLSLPLHIDGGSSDAAYVSFLESNALANYPRSNHTQVLVRPSTDSAKAYVFVIGGRGTATGETAGTDTVISATIGGSEDTVQDGYVPSGWFYSNTYAINFLSAQLQEVSWSVTIPDRNSGSNADVAVDYRLSGTDCSSPSWGSWQELDYADGDPDTGFRSLDGWNHISNINAGLGARCFQYRAELTTASKTVTPVLLNVGIQLSIPGNPDLFVSELTDSRYGDNLLTGLSVKIKNENLLGTDPTTLGVDEVSTTGSGGFYADLFIYGPATTAPTVPSGDSSIPTDESNTNNKAYALLYDQQFPANAIVSISSWCKQDSATTCTTFDPLAYFKEKGTGWYTVMVVVDSTGYVDEGTDGGELNNATTYSFQVSAEDIRYVSLMPQIHR